MFISVTVYHRDILSLDLFSISFHGMTAFRRATPFYDFSYGNTLLRGGAPFSCFNCRTIANSSIKILAF